MLERLKQYIVEVCCAYALVSVGGAIVNQICGFQTNNVNVMIMFVLCLIGTFVLYLHRLFDRFSPLFMIIAQYVIACAAVGLILLMISVTISPISPKGWFEFYRSFIVPYIFFAGYYYYRVFAETRKQDELIRDIQAQQEEKPEEEA